MVSVIIPMRNEEQHIAKTLESLLVQTYPRECYELIVIDGQSSDRSLEIVEDLKRSAPGIRILTNSAGIVPIALNLGILNARGEYAGVTMYAAKYAVCTENGAQTLDTEPLYAGSPA